MIKISDQPVEGKTDRYLLLILVFALSGIYFLLFVNYIFFYQENRMLFIYSWEYSGRFFSKPGGLLEYAGNFLTQGYINNIYGSVIVAIVLTAVAAVFLKINKKLSPGNSFSLMLASVASCVLLLMHTNINYRIHNNLGFLITGIWFLITISNENKISRIIILSFFPVFFFVTGTYAWLYLGMATIYNIFRKNLIFTVLLWIVAAFTILISKMLIFLQPWTGLISYPLPAAGYFSRPSSVWIILLFFVFYPAFIILSGKLKMSYNRNLSVYSFLAVFILTTFILLKNYSRDTSQVFRLEKMFFARDWDGVINYQETYRNRNLVAQYYYNTALAERGMLCDRMFSAPQDYGTMSVMIPWSSQISMNRLFRGVYFYYTIGLVNEAHRWAFESMVTEGFHPENIKLLIKTNLINGHYKIAEKYITVLKKTLHYKRLAGKFESMLSNPELIRSDPELSERAKLKPQDNFVITIRNPETNINSLLQSNPGNIRALEYKLACLMLDKKSDEVVNNLSNLLDTDNQRIPRHIEEAALFYQFASGPLPDLALLRISGETISRFSDYIKLTKNISRDQIRQGSGIREDLKKTYWYYLDTR